MKITIDEELMKICRTIVSENKSISQWSEIESDDMFQLGKYEGGFSATEKTFCFSAYINETEYWLYLSLQDTKDIVSGNKIEITLEEPNRL